MTSAPLPNRRGTEVETEAAACVGGLFERHGRMVYGVCRAMLRDVHEAEDAAQQVFLSAHKALLGRAHVRDPGGWLATIARNECRGRIAAGMRSPLPVADEDLAAIPSPVDEQARHDQALAFREALAALPERQREAVVLRYLYGLRYGEVAKALGLSRPATEALLFRARRGLRGRLRPVVGTTLVVPLALREELALAIPGFSAGAGSGAATLGVAGGVLAKLTAGPVGVKVATAAVAVSTVGAVGTMESDSPARSEAGRASVVTSSTDELSSASERDDRYESSSDQNGIPSRGSRDEVDRRGSGGREHSESDDSGPSSSGRGESSPADDGSRSGSSGDEDAGRSGSEEGADSGAAAEQTDSSGSESGGSSGSESGGSSDDDSSSGSSGSGSAGSGSGSSDSSGSSEDGSSGSSGSGTGSGSGETPDDEER